MFFLGVEIWETQVDKKSHEERRIEAAFTRPNNAATDAS